MIFCTHGHISPYEFDLHAVPVKVFSDCGVRYPDFDREDSIGKAVKNRRGRAAVTGKIRPRAGSEFAQFATVDPARGFDGKAGRRRLKPEDLPQSLGCPRVMGLAVRLRSVPAGIPANEPPRRGFVVRHGGNRSARIGVSHKEPRL